MRISELDKLTNSKQFKSNVFQPMNQKAESILSSVRVNMCDCPSMLSSLSSVIIIELLESNNQSLSFNLIVDLNGKEQNLISTKEN